MSKLLDDLKRSEPTVFDHIRWKWRAFWRVVEHIPYGIKNVFRWAPVIWHDVDWDWSYLGQVMEYKLRRMSMNHRDHGYHVGSDRCARQTLVCAELLKRLLADNYAENAGWTMDRDKWEAIPKQRQRAIFQHARKMYTQDQRYLGLLLGKYLTHWWE